MAAVVVKTGAGIALGERQLATLRSAGAELIERDCPTERDLLDHAANADALLVLNEPITARVLARLSRCRVIARFGVGVDTIDLEAATAVGIQVTNVPGASVEEVSDHALAMLLTLARRLPTLDAAVRRGDWSHQLEPAPRRLRGQVLGLVGLGRIGTALARKAAALGMRLIAHDPYVTESGSATLVALDALLRRSDYVSVHVPLLAETRGLIGARELSLMKRSAVLINVARGEVVDQAALTDALVAGRLAGAGLDVLAHEPPARDDPLLKLANVVLSPHAAHYSLESLEEVRQTAVEEVVRVLGGKPPLHPVNRLSRRPANPPGGQPAAERAAGSTSSAKRSS